MTDRSDTDFEEQPARFVRQFALTRGRAVSTENLALDTLVETVVGATPSRPLDPEHNQILDLARSTISIAELSAHVGVHLGIARVLVGDLVAGGLVAVGVSDNTDEGPSLESLEMLLHDLIEY